MVSLGTLKGQINKTRDIQGDLPLHDIIRRAINAYGATTTFLNCRASFSRTGLIQKPGTMRAEAHVIPGFFDHLIATRRDIINQEQLKLQHKKRGRKPTPFGFINEIEFNSLCNL
ncbi:MAG: hypothetical protein EZS28_018227 [Streblomastix strix]|uniref:Uncharacterized protein n=1 Tax=Streblomastix strix TaxID=222440 RepID=A0A5J4VVQ5_9EUKA|nr:MAG: hypothetical protein EZS28_018227 [Streblomastix strix]